MQRTLSTQLEHEPEMLQCHNLFHTFLIVKDCRVCTIIDSGSCNNLVTSDLVKKLGLTTRAHSKPYHLEWLNNSGKAKVTRSAQIHFFVGSYHDYPDFDVVPMQACSLLLGRHVNMILMLYIKVELIHIHCCIKARKLFCCL